MSRFIFTHSNRFGLVALTSKTPSDNELAEVSHVCSQPSCHPTELQSSFYSSTIPSIVPRSVSGDMSVQIPEWPSLPLISSFQDLRDQFSMCCPCVNLWHLWFLWIFFWLFPCYLYSYLCPHSGTMTCSVCPCQTIACQCFCVHCSLVENVVHCT